MPTPEELEYQQYLIETGQAQAPRTREQIVAEALKTLDNTDYGAAMNNALSVGGGGLAKALPGVASKLGTFLTGGLESGLLGAAQSPGERGEGAAKAAALDMALRGAGKILGKGGDVGMQIAVGRKKYTPGVGTELADEGLIGTQRQMAKQTARGLERTGKGIKDAATRFTGPIDARQIGQEMGEELTSPLTGGGIIAPSARDAAEVEQLRKFAEDVASRGGEVGPAAAARRTAAGSSAFSQKTGNPLYDPIASASKLEQQKYSQAMKSASPGAYSDLNSKMIQGGEMVPLDARYAALKKAEKALAEEPSLPRSILGLASMTSKSVPGGSLVTSGIAQGLNKGGRLAEFLAPLARQAAVGGSRDAGPSAQELAEYEQYLRETGQK